MYLELPFKFNYPLKACSIIKCVKVQFFNLIQAPLVFTNKMFSYKEQKQRCFFCSNIISKTITLICNFILLNVLFTSVKAIVLLIVLKQRVTIVVFHSNILKFIASSLLFVSKRKAWEKIKPAFYCMLMLYCGVDKSLHSWVLILVYLTATFNIPITLE